MFLSKLKIGTKLIILVLLVLAILLGVGTLGVLSLKSSSEAVHKNYTKGLVPTEQLGHIQELIQRTRLQIAFGMMHDPRNPEMAKLHNHAISLHTDQIKKDIKTIQEKWPLYKASLDLQDRVLGENFEKSWGKYLNEGLKPCLNLLLKNKVDLAYELMMLKMNPLSKKLNLSIEKLFEMQLSDGKNMFTTAKNDYEFSRNISILSTVLGILISLLFAFSIIKGITNPIKNFIEKFRKGTEGHLDIQVEIVGQDEMAELGNFFNSYMNKLKDIVSSIISSSHQILQAVSEVSSGNQDLSNRVSAQSASLEETASSIEEMTANLKNMAENASSSQKVVSVTQTNAEEGRKIIQQTVEAMQSVSEKAEKINEIVKIINSIAFQTNILALNAAVEAARAKEHGKGFAVVANEVRNLAQKSAENATQIENMIGDVVYGIQKGNSQVEASQEKFLEIQSHILESGQLINEVTASAEEQSNGVEQINQAVSHLDEITQNNASLVEELSASTEELESQTREVIDMMSFFKLTGE